MKKQWLTILLAALIFSLAACAKPAEPSPVVVSSVLVLPPEQPAPAQVPEEAEEASEPEQDWTQEDICRMYQSIQEPDWVFIDCLTTPDKANGCVGAVLYRDGETSMVSFFDEDGFAYRAGPVARTAEDPEFSYLGDGTVAFCLLTDSGETYDYTLTFELSEDGSHANWTAK